VDGEQGEVTYWLKMSYLLIVAALLAFAVYGCASSGSTKLADQQQAVQNCILSGGHARLGPNNTILCVR